MNTRTNKNRFQISEKKAELSIGDLERLIWIEDGVRYTYNRSKNNIDIHHHCLN